MSIKESNPEGVTQYTQNLQKEYYSNKGRIPKEAIYQTMFKEPVKQRRTNASAQRQLTNRLLQHKENVNMKVKEKIYQNNARNTLEERKKKSRRSLNPDYRMYDHQIKKDMQKKARMVEI